MPGCVALLFLSYTLEGISSPLTSFFIHLSNILTLPILFAPLPLVLLAILYLFWGIEKYKLGLGDAALAILIIIPFFILEIALLFYLSVGPRPTSTAQCSFPTGFTCVTHTLQAGTGRFYLKIGKGPGNIQINGINCTQQTDMNKMTSGAYIVYQNYNLAGAGCAAITNKNVSSGSSFVVADSIGVNSLESGCPANVSNIICTTSNGVLPSDAEVGSVYDGKIYINYTELDTGLTRIVVGAYTEKYEA